MLSDDALCLRIRTGEDSITEFKTDGACGKSELRKTLTAFANTVAEGSIAVLFAGVSDKGEISGVSNADNLQKNVHSVCSTECYPPITHLTRSFDVEGKTVVAIMIQFSKARPHFSGPAYVRVGTQSINATEETYEALISSRHEKSGKILQWRDREIYLFAPIHLGVALFGDPSSSQSDTQSSSTAVRGFRCVVRACDPFCVQLENMFNKNLFPVPLKDVEISWTLKTNELHLMLNSERYGT